MEGPLKPLWSSSPSSFMYNKYWLTKIRYNLLKKNTMISETWMRECVLPSTHCLLTAMWSHVHVDTYYRLICGHSLVSMWRFRCLSYLCGPVTAALRKYLKNCKVSQLGGLRDSLATSSLWLNYSKTYILMHWWAYWK